MARAKRAGVKSHTRKTSIGQGSKCKSKSGVRRTVRNK